MMPKLASPPIYTAIIMGLTLLSPCLSSAEDQWLTKPERDFLKLFGRDVSIGGKDYYSEANLISIHQMTRESDASIRRELEIICASRDKMRLTGEDWERFKVAQKRAKFEMSKHSYLSLLAMLVGVDPFDAVIDFTDGILKSGAITDIWRMQGDWIIRGMEAQAEADAALGRILAALETRIPARKYAPVPRLAATIGNSRLKIVGKLDDVRLREPVVLMILHRSGAGGKFVLQTLAGVGMMNAIGVRGMNLQAAFAAGWLAGAQELLARCPVVRLQLIPTVEAGKLIAIDTGLSMAEVCSLERVEVKVWSADACFAIDELPGLDSAKKLALALAEKERQDRIAAANKARAIRNNRLRNDEIFARIDNFIAQGVKNALITGQRQQMENMRRSDEIYYRNIRGGRP